jgi:anti-sigma B factor antagonist
VEYNLDDDSGVRIVRLQGPTDVSQALELRELLGQQIDAPGARVLLDLSAVTLVDSSGVGVLVAAHRRAEAAGATMALAGASQPVGRVFELTRTDRLLRIYSTVEDGLEALRA